MDRPVSARIDVTGDFAFAVGPRAREWIGALTGFEHEFTDAVALATRGTVQRGEAAGAAHGAVRWLAIGDLVGGRCGEGIAAFAGDAPQAAWRGRFVQLLWDPSGAQVIALTDHFSSLPLYVFAQGENLLLATDLRLILACGAARREVDPTAIYHYLNFGCIPAPATICREVRRVEPGTRLVWRSGALHHERYYVPAYPDDLAGEEGALAAGLIAQISSSVRAYRPDDGPDWGCFLSGGTDSSSIVSLLARERTPVRTFSIGFSEAGYDELDYARLAAESCGATPETGRVERGDALELIHQVVAAYDQPFGNPSAIPTIACANLAADLGARVLLGGDGGDEVFGGNQRYAKDQVMQAYYRLPGVVKALGRGVGRLAGKSSSHLLNRVENFVQRSSLPNPDRFYTDDSFASDYYAELLTPEFRREVAAPASLDLMREVYALGGAASPLHRIMRLDLLMAIAQNDLVKVHGACKAAGISARFPYLDPILVAHVGRLPQRYKVRGLDKRYLFKRAMKGVLPEETLKKKKQGFGLPIAIWLREDEAFQQALREVLFDPRTLARGWFEAAFVERLIAEHLRGSWDHAVAIWQLAVLELWLRKYVDAD